VYNICTINTGYLKKRENGIISLRCVKVFFAVLDSGNRVGAVCLKQKIAEKIVLCSEKDWLHG